MLEPSGQDEEGSPKELLEKGCGRGATPGTPKEGLLRTEANGELNWSMAYAPAGTKGQFIMKPIFTVTV